MKWRIAVCFTISRFRRRNPFQSLHSSVAINGSSRHTSNGERHREAVKARRLSAGYRVRLKNWERLGAVAECGANEQKHEALRPLSRYRGTRRIGHCPIANTR